MTLLKRFTGWAIGLSKILDRKGLFLKGVRSLQLSRRDHPSSQFQTLYWHLLLSYLAAMAAIVGVSTLAIYQVVAYTLYQQLDRQLDSLAQAAAHSLPALEAQQGTPLSRLPPVTDNDGDIDLPWQDLRVTTQSIEWFDQTLNRLAQTGNHFPATSLRTIGFANVEDLRTLTIPVYLVQDNGPSRQFRGYVRVSQLTEDLQEELDRLSIALAVGGVIAGVLIGGTGWWLTRRSVRPIEQSVLQLQQFTADASHELRSPLTAIKTAVEVMQSHPERIHPNDVKKLDAIDSATQQMTHLVEDLLLLARMEVTTELRVKL
ncbi:MAG TPA: histidine kinase dimerization/phospho-acceptor domain-containing protein, partial [Allocoleopsis sp.]